jgi:hypothetical protein
LSAKKKKTIRKLREASNNGVSKPSRVAREVEMKKTARRNRSDEKRNEEGRSISYSKETIIPCKGFRFPWSWGVKKKKRIMIKEDKGKYTNKQT